MLILVISEMPWLMKAEPDSRVVKGKDVKFSVDDFEEIGTSPWDGVRNHEAKTIMRDKMKLGDKVLFYHSNCKVPGVFGLAKIAKEGYPDYTSWDPKHPYYDEKSDKEKPTWFMVDVKFESKLEFPPTLALIKLLASLTSLPDEVRYIGESGFQAIKSMQLVNRGRLSVQPVDETAYHAVVKLGTQGGWEGLLPPSGKARKAKMKSEAPDSAVDVKEEDDAPTKGKMKPANGAKREVKKEKTKREPEPPIKQDEADGLRRSKRVRR